VGDNLASRRRTRAEAAAGIGGPETGGGLVQRADQPCRAAPGRRGPGVRRQAVPAAGLPARVVGDVAADEGQYFPGALDPQHPGERRRTPPPADAAGTRARRGTTAPSAAAAGHRAGPPPRSPARRRPAPRHRGLAGERSPGQYPRNRRQILPGESAARLSHSGATMTPTQITRVYRATGPHVPQTGRFGAGEVLAKRVAGGADFRSPSWDLGTGPAW
jgi:hypothetical protein